MASISAPPPVVAYQGEPGAFSEEALRLHFGDRARPLPCPDFEAAAGAVLGSRAAFAVLPVENSGAGPVEAAKAAIRSSGLAQVARVILPLRQMLLGLPGARMEALREIRSHPIALAQCARFLAAHPGIVARAVGDTAGAAREVAASGDPGLGALASLAAAEAWGLQVLAADVHDDPENRTTFVVVARPGTSGAERHGG